ncbi:hypothetical protein RCL1_002053 [Eukaryota sp. TZLM3-RCL]
MKLYLKGLNVSSLYDVLQCYKAHSNVILLFSGASGDDAASSLFLMSQINPNINARVFCSLSLQSLSSNYKVTSVNSNRIAIEVPVNSLINNLSSCLNPEVNTDLLLSPNAIPSTPAFTIQSFKSGTEHFISSFAVTVLSPEQLATLSTFMTPNTSFSLALQLTVDVVTRVLVFVNRIKKCKLVNIGVKGHSNGSLLFSGSGNGFELNMELKQLLVKSRAIDGSTSTQSNETNQITLDLKSFELLFSALKCNPLKSQIVFRDDNGDVDIVSEVIGGHVRSRASPLVINL